MFNLIAVIITKNEAHHIADCIESLRDWVDAVVVWDSGNSDETVAIAQQADALVVERPFDHFSAQRQAALDTLSAEWFFFVDADERATEAVAQEISATIQQTTCESPVGYWIARRNFIVGRETRHSGYFPDYQLRLLRRGRATYDPTREVHEIVELDGDEGYLKEPLIHLNYTSWAQFHQKQRFYAAYEARILASRGIQPRPHNFVLQPLRELRRRFVTLNGWRDGRHGLKLALWFAWYYGFMPYWDLLHQFPDRNPQS